MSSLHRICLAKRIAGSATVLLAACVGGGGGGTGGGGSSVIAAGKEGDLCNPKVVSGGCNGSQPMNCTADPDPANTVGGKWKAAGAACSKDQFCGTTTDANTKITTAECKSSQVSTGGQDATTGGGSDTVTGGGSDTVTGGGKDGTSGGDTVVSSDIGGTIDIGAIMACAKSKCASQYSACQSDSTCGTALTCAEKCKDIQCMAACPQPATNAAYLGLQQCISAQKCVPTTPSAVCGNGQCEAGETKTNCAKDCGTSGPVCGNGTCESGETMSTCPQDCKTTSNCGNGKCEPGETTSSCPKDCPPSTGKVCGDAKCDSGESCPMDCNSKYLPTTQCSVAECPNEMQGCGSNSTCVDFFNCVASCSCNDSCMKECGSMPGAQASQTKALVQCLITAECPNPCGSSSGPVCGNGTCESGETPSSCPSDCKSGPVCGNGKCESGESPSSCPSDCKSGPVCGNGTCEPGESASTCPADCGTSSGHICDQYCGSAPPSGACYCDATCKTQGDCCDPTGTKQAGKSCTGSTCADCN